mgnify:CR=1 FL=1
MRYVGQAAVAALMLCALLWFAGCSTSSGQAENSLVVTPARAFLTPRSSQAFTTNLPVHWRVVEENGGTITPAGVYTAPDSASTFHVVATCISDDSITRTVEIFVAWARQADR